MRFTTLVGIVALAAGSVSSADERGHGDATTPTDVSLQLRTSLSMIEANELFAELQKNPLYRMPRAEIHCFKRAYLAGYDLEHRKPEGLFTRLLDVDCRGASFGVIDPRTRSYHEYIDHKANLVTVKDAQGRPRDYVLDMQFSTAPVPLEVYLKRLLPPRPTLRLVNATNWTQERILKVFEDGTKIGVATCFYALTDRRQTVPDPNVKSEWSSYHLEDYRQEIEKTNAAHLNSKAYLEVLKAAPASPKEIGLLRAKERRKSLQSQIQVFEYERDRRNKRPTGKLNERQKALAAGVAAMPESYLRTILLDLKGELQSLQYRAKANP